MIPRKMEMLERVLDVLDEEKVSNERVSAFRGAFAVYEKWEDASLEASKC